MSSSPTVVVVTQRSWMARELAANTRGVVVAGEPGLFWPAVAAGPDVAWWMPIEFATLLHCEGDCPALSAPGASWLSGVDTDLTGRTVHTSRVEEFDGPPAGIPLWCKPAEAKIERFPGGWYTPDQVAALELHPGSWVQWTPTRLDLSVEFRCYVLEGAVETVSPYLLGDLTFYDLDEATLAAVPAADATEFARTVVDRLGAAQPVAYVLDVGFDLLSGRWVVVEANPAWCSAWYGCAIDAVLATITASCRCEDEWRWVPDAELVHHARRAGPLHRRLTD